MATIFELENPIFVVNVEDSDSDIEEHEVNMCTMSSVEGGVEYSNEQSDKMASLLPKDGTLFNFAELAPSPSKDYCQVMVTTNQVHRLY